MKNKYHVNSVRPVYANNDRVKGDYMGEEEYTQYEVVADAVVNNEGYLTFMDLPAQTDDGVHRPAQLVQIVAPGWARVINQGPFIQEVADNG